MSRDLFQASAEYHRENQCIFCASPIPQTIGEELKGGWSHDESRLRPIKFEVLALATLREFEDYRASIGADNGDGDGWWEGQRFYKIRAMD